MTIKLTKDSIDIGVAEEGGGDPEILATISNKLSILLKHLKKLGPSSRLPVHSGRVEAPA